MLSNSGKGEVQKSAVIYSGGKIKLFSDCILWNPDHSIKAYAFIAAFSSLKLTKLCLSFCQADQEN